MGRGGERVFSRHWRMRSTLSSGKDDEAKMADDAERAMNEEGGSHDEKRAQDERDTSYGGYADVKELTTKSLKIQNKMYYLDVKENSRRRFVKITEIFPNRNKNRFTVPMTDLPEMREKFSAFAEFYAGLDPHEQGKQDEERPREPLMSETLVFRQNRRMFIELRQNRGGYFLRVSKPYYGNIGGPHRLFIPAQGIADLRNYFSEILDEFGVDEDEDELQLPDAKEVRIEQKRFYFDVGDNRRGVFVRLSEVTNSYRTCVTIPRKGWEKIIDAMSDLCNKVPYEGGRQSAGNTSGEYE